MKRTSPPPPLSQSRKDGGLIAARGLYYQYVYALRLMRLVWTGVYTHIALEQSGDFAAWKQRSDRTIDDLLLVEVKTRPDSCFLTDRAAVSKVWRRFAQLLAHLPKGVTPSTRVSCRLVINEVHDCQALSCESELTSENAYLELQQTISRAGFTFSPESIDVERFFRLPFERGEVLHELGLLGDDVALALGTPPALEAVIQGIVGLVMPLFVRRSSGAGAAPELLALDRILFDRTHTLDTVRAAIESALSRVALNERHLEVAARMERARARWRRSKHPAEARGRAMPWRSTSRVPRRPSTS